MSSSMPIPAPSTPAAAPAAYGQAAKAPASSSSSSSYSSSPVPSSPRSAQKKRAHERRPSLLSSAIAKEDCNVINIGDPDGPPRLISYLASSQGFAWNPEIFLPSYVDYEYVPLENRREPVHEIRLSDEEIKNMFPQ